MMYSLSGHVRRLILGAASLVVVPIVVLGYDIAGSKLDRMGDEGLRRDMAELQQLIVLSNDRKEYAAQQSEERAVIAPPVAARSTRHAFQAWDGSNRMAATSPDFAHVPLDAAGAGWSDLSIDDHRWRVLTLLDNDRHWLRVAERNDARNAMKRTLLALLLGIGLIAVPLCAWVGGLAVGRALEPLRILTERIDERRPGHLASIGNDGLPMELDPFVAAFNALLARLRTGDVQTAPAANEKQPGGTSKSAAVLVSQPIRGVT